MAFISSAVKVILGTYLHYLYFPEGDPLQCHPEGSQIQLLAWLLSHLCAPELPLCWSHWWLRCLCTPQLCGALTTLSAPRNGVTQTDLFTEIHTSLADVVLSKCRIRCYIQTLIWQM